MNIPPLIIRDFNGCPLAFRADGWFNMTKAAIHFDRDLSSFLRSVEAEAFVRALSVELAGERLVQVQRGNGKLPAVGTWAHPKLALFFARRLGEQFAVWLDTTVEEILRGEISCAPARTVEPGPSLALLEAVFRGWPRLTQEDARHGGL